MARRAVLSLAASAIIGIGLLGTISTDASAYRAGVYRGGAYRGGVYRGGVYRGGYYRGVRPGVAVGIGAAAVGAAAVGAAAAVLITPPAITALLPPSVVHTATIIMPPTTAAYPRHSSWRTSEKKSYTRWVKTRRGTDESAAEPGIATISPSVRLKLRPRLRLQKVTR